jgi:hypothetical protein
VRILHEAVRATDEPGHQLRAPLVHHILMRRSTGVPQLRASSEEITNGEDGEPLGSDEALRSNRLPAEASNLDEHRDPEEAVDDRVLLSSLGEEAWVEFVTS